jgi:hypothetical protein
MTPRDNARMARPTELRDDPRVREIALRRPPKLYKYTTLDGPRSDWTRSLIVDSALFFARPSMFNDPLDCRIPPSFEADAESIKGFWRDRWAQQGRPPRSQQELQQMVAMSETEAGRQRLTKVYYELLDTYGIACFNTRPDNFLLWSYYADKHSGVAVRFDTRDEFLEQIPQPYLPLKVEYAKEFPRVSMYDPDRFGLIQNTLGTKADVWRHEGEWRLITVGRWGIVKMPAGMIDGVVLGLRTSRDVEGEVRRWVADAGREIELLRIRHRPNSFALEVVPA